MDNTAGHDPCNRDQPCISSKGNAPGQDIHGIGARCQVENNCSKDKPQIIFNSKHVNGVRVIC